ncbi:MAG: hypothetical protein HZA13_10530 [Nitrospirae bacterium]|nr:hypothetical protein [Nitrospirota bacterium]
MKRIWLIGLLTGVLVVSGISFSYALFGLWRSPSGSVTTYVATLQGLNQDMREALHRVREGHDVQNNIEILHDQLHLMRDILHLIDKQERQQEPFITLHDLNHVMRDTWHEIKKDRDREANLGKLHDQLHEMRETLHSIEGEPGKPEGR